MLTVPLLWDWVDGCGNVVLLLDDNPAFEGLFEFCSISAGGSIGERFTLLGTLQFGLDGSIESLCGVICHVWRAFRARICTN